MSKELVIYTRYTYPYATCCSRNSLKYEMSLKYR